jgi:hypothetical protein
VATEPAIDRSCTSAEMLLRSLAMLPQCNVAWALAGQSHAVLLPLLLRGHSNAVLVVEQSRDVSEVLETSVALRAVLDPLPLAVASSEALEGGLPRTAGLPMPAAFSCRTGRYLKWWG